MQLRNLFDLATAEEYKRQASLLPYTLLAFIGSDGRSVNIVCPYDAYDETTDNQQQALTNAYRKLHFIYSAQLSKELDEGRRYWLSDEDNAHNIKHNARYQQVNDHSQMVTLTHLTPEDTPSDTAFVPLYDILERLRKEFPTFAINRSTDRSVGRCLHALGYEYKKTSKGIFYKIKAIQP